MAKEPGVLGAERGLCVRVGLRNRCREAVWGAGPSGRGSLSAVFSMRLGTEWGACVLYGDLEIRDQPGVSAGAGPAATGPQATAGSEGSSAAR